MYWIDKEIVSIKDGTVVYKQWDRDVTRFVGKLADHIATDEPIDHTAYADRLYSVLWDIFKKALQSENPVKACIDLMDERGLSADEISYIYQKIDDELTFEYNKFMKENETVQEIKNRMDTLEKTVKTMYNSIDQSIQSIINHTLWYGDEEVISVAKWSFRSSDLKQLLKKAKTQ